uniref:CMP-N-acetylneuraminate-beta-galactosamide-alpha-2,3-sialyltransferase 4 n=2 Tax=Geotrypetes seraphini TaxID=260995 RepID=A0A6P8NXU9_GEOSA|nr:CMP-N-acetylneuraminate-beta-galactosamide-alpha-2,3-sialyltransferase 4 isoform X1 [Geotrypetes seraphini]XP_033773630.1 CMP-N-acetylneuraminate-beta-galactosamide-alpha-2,3-sialyltransferase 4 isoform X1 [Geotrypetes seraphini]XP_033773631.1 CMP-N-acetylneuraminate-beta-galactosamide-alpha-2,3-sialyltransferase 4 isoform X1 [Geotrypetes seraphini]XP_033773632.1 CMP-N-acetylneuraminate-beta-galactosamide-alpha-2,3-sialyltransferase 4 isoform X1 [Geotrypetes seraphini]XP_033773633.1 CMP-N-ac
MTTDNLTNWRVLALFMLGTFFSVAVVWYLRAEPNMPVPYVIAEDDGMMCLQGNMGRKALLLIENYSRNHPAFLQMSDFFWEKNQSVYQLPYGTQGSEEILLKVLALTMRYDMPDRVQSLPCWRCVVVGNGHRLKNSSLGDVINKYDIVMRLNNAPVHKYEHDVGNKTTLRLFYPESADFDPHLQNNPDSLMVLVPFKTPDIQWLKAVLNNEKRSRKGFWKSPPLIWDVKPENVRILNPYFMEVTASKLLNVSIKPPRKNKEKPTTGLLAITFALHICDVVHIAGFGYPETTNKKQTIHYYEQITLTSMADSDHNVSHEAQAIRRLLEARIIRNLTRF